MRVAKLNKLTGSSLISTNVPASTYNEYVPGTTYSKGSKVKVSVESDGSTPRFPVEEFESNTNSNSGNYPPGDSINWFNLGSENRWRMFDEFLNVITVNSEFIEVEIDAGYVNIVGLFGLKAKTVTFTHYSRVNEIRETKSEAISLVTTGRNPVGWYSYYNTKQTYKKNILWDFPYYSEASLKIRIEWLPGENAECAECAIGEQVEIGRSQYAPTLNFRDFSLIEEDKFGRITTSKGDWAKDNRYNLWLNNYDVDRIHGVLSDLFGERVIFDGNNHDSIRIFDSMIVYGLMSRAEIAIEGSRESKLQFKIKGLTQK